MKRFANDNHLVSFVGLVLSTHTSDENLYVNGISVRQNPFLRTMMIEAAWTAVREDLAMTLKFKELSKRMKSQDAIIRIAKKLVTRVVETGRICLCARCLTGSPMAEPLSAEKNCSEGMPSAK
jgi:transposase